MNRVSLLLLLPIFNLICLLSLSQGRFAVAFEDFDLNYDADDDISLEDALKLSRQSIISSDNITDWIPISANITVGANDYYQFTVGTDSSGLGFAPSYEILIFLSGNLCEQPKYPNGSFAEVPDDMGLRVVYSFNESLSFDSNTTYSQQFGFGYMEALAVSPLVITDSLNDTSDSDNVTSDFFNVTSDYSTLYIMLQLYNETTGKPLIQSKQNEDIIWNYKLSISESDLIYQWDERSWLEVLDTDHNSALLMTGNLTSNGSNSATNYSFYDDSLYDMYVYSYDEYINIENNSLSHSINAIKNGKYLVSSISETNQSKNLEETNLRVQKYVGASINGASEYFYVTGLNLSTTYVAYLTKKIGQNGNISDTGGVIFSAELFTTAEDNTCSLIYGLGFCEGVTYSVPTSSLAGGNKTLMAQTYEYITSGLYSNFTKALQLTACDSELDARYSPLRTCEDCAQSYRNWLCAVSIPRCTTTKSDYYIKRNKDSNRNTFIDRYVKPFRDYYEILPCIDMCYYIVRDCPSSLKFACPDSKKNEQLLLNSYNYLLQDSDEPTCNFMGNFTYNKKH